MNSTWHIRPEYFGGLLIHVPTFAKYQIGPLDFVFFKVLLGGGSEEVIKEEMGRRLGVLYRSNHSFARRVKQDIVLRADFDVASAVDEAVGLLESCEGLGHLSAPLEVTIYPTMKCQLSCDFCFVKELISLKDCDLPAGDWIALCGDMVESGVQSISILGGEPTLYRDIVELMEGLDRLGVRISFTSNGQSMRGRLLDKVAQLNNMTSIFSLHSMDLAKNRRRMGRAYSVSKIKEACQALNVSGKPVRLNSVITDQSESDFRAMAYFAAECGVEKWSLPYPYSSPALMTFSEFLARVKVVRKCAEEAGIGEIVSPEGCMIYAQAEGAELDLRDITLYQLHAYGCEVGETILEIGPKGDVYPCAALFQTEIVAGNVFEADWKNIWNDSPTLSAFRERVSPVDCSACRLSVFCKGGCPAYSMSTSGSLEVKDARCELPI